MPGLEAGCGPRPCDAFRALWLLGAMAFLGQTTRGQQVPGDQPLGDLGFEQLAKIRVTSVSRQEGTLQRSAAAVFVINAQMIERSGATTIPELLRMVPGLTVARLDNNKWAVSARGFNERFGGKLLVQIDGRSVYNPISSGVYWDTVDYPLDDIDRIEVIRGPGASVWGANAVNGVINIVTKKAKETSGIAAAAGFGTNERGFGQIRYGGAVVDAATYRAYLKGADRSEQHSATISPHDGWRNARGGFRFDWQASDRDEVTVLGDYGQSVAGRFDLRPKSTAPFYVSNSEDDVSHAAYLLTRWDRRASDHAGWSLQVYRDSVHRRSDAGYVDLSWKTWDVDFQHQFAVSRRHQVIYGAGYRSVDIGAKNSSPDGGFAVAWLRNQSRQQLFSTFLQDQIALAGDRLTLTIGSKFERNNLTGFEIQPTVRLLAAPTERQTVWAAWSRAVRTPSFIEDQSLIKAPTSPGAGTLLEIRSNSALDAEVVRAWDLGYRAQITDSFSVDAAAFYNEYDRLVGTVRGTPVSAPPVVFVPVTRANVLRGETYGVEAAFTWQVTSSWHLSGGYTALRMHLHRAAGLPATAEAAEGQSPRQQMTLQSNWDLPRTVRFDLFGRFVSGLHGFNPAGAAGVSDRVPAYSALDARLSWRPRRELELSIAGQNLLSGRHAEFGTSPLVRSPLVEIERNVHVKAAWMF